MTNNFLPEDYKQPDNSRYMKFKEGENRFRIMSSAITGFEYWTNDNKPVRSKEMFKSTPDIRIVKGEKTKISHFWAFVVWNYDKEAINILEVTQKGIQSFILALVKNKDWGDPKQYDIIVSREGEGFDTKYSVMPCPSKPVNELATVSYGSMTIKLEKLYTGEDPFEQETTPEQTTRESEEINREFRNNDVTMEDIK